MSKVDDFARLTCLNSMLSLLSGGPTNQSEQISAVLRFLRSENSSSLPPSDYNENVTRIVELHDPGQRRFSGTTHWDVRDDCIDPLWLRANLLAKLDLLENEPRGLLIISGLRQRLCPPGRRWTKRRAARYHDLVAYVEKAAVEKASLQVDLTLLFV